MTGGIVMAKQKTRLEQFNERVDALKDEHIEYLDGVSGIKRKLMESVLHDWCVVCVKLEDVIEDVIETGTTITLKNGNPAKNLVSRLLCLDHAPANQREELDASEDAQAPRRRGRGAC